MSDPSDVSLGWTNNLGQANNDGFLAPISLTVILRTWFRKHRTGQSLKGSLTHKAFLSEMIVSFNFQK